jgi:hypothetical protein
MNNDQPPHVANRLVLITKDRDYADFVRSTLAIARGAFRVEQISPDDLLSADLEARISAASDQAPTLVILDVDCETARQEFIAARRAKRRPDRAVECVITRAAFDEAVARRRRDLDAMCPAAADISPNIARPDPRRLRRPSSGPGSRRMTLVRSRGGGHRNRE